MVDDAVQKPFEASHFMAACERRWVGGDQEEEDPFIFVRCEIDIVAQFVDAIGQGKGLLDHLRLGGEGDVAFAALRKHLLPAVAFHFGMGNRSK